MIWNSLKRLRIVNLKKMKNIELSKSYGMGVSMNCNVWYVNY